MTPTPGSPRPPISHHDGRPLYRQVADRLREQIHGGHYPPGQRLPSAREFSAGLGVSREVVHHAIRTLRDEGLVTRGRGCHHHVRVVPERRWLGVGPSSVVVARMPTREEVCDLQLPEGVPVLVVDARVYPADRVGLHVDTP